MTTRALVHRILSCAAAAALIVVSTAVPSASAQEPAACPGAQVSVVVDAASLADGAWSLTDGCIPPQNFYEVELAGYRLVLALAPVDYDGGQQGLLALASLSTPEGQGASLVGVEDAPSGFVRWIYSEGDATAATDSLSFEGTGPTDVPDETGSLELDVVGEGTDLLHAQDAVTQQVRGVILDAVSTLLED